MQPFTTVTGPAAPLMLANIDTDVIIRIDRKVGVDRSALGRYAFEALRYLPDGAENPSFVFNRVPFRGAPILLAGRNFGCGSARETAAWALQGMGVRCVIADGFGDIFYSNCLQNGILPIRLPEETIAALARKAERGAIVVVDLDAQTVTVEEERVAFDIDRLRKAGLLAGLDDLGQTIEAMDDIRSWQDRDRKRRPWVWRPVERSSDEAGHV